MIALEKHMEKQKQKTHPKTNRNWFSKEEFQYTLSFRSLGSIRFYVLKEVSYAHQCSI